MIFASSLAVYGGALPPEVGEATALMPQSSYGAQKAIGELLVNDYSRKGFIDGMALRLPTVVVRPGLPNRAASTFASSMIREPLTGRDAVCPVSPDTVMALASPRRIVAGLAHALDLPSGALGASRSLQLPGFSVSVGEMAEALRRAAGEEAYRRIRGQPDPQIQAIISSWPQALAAPRAEALGFGRDSGIDEVIAAFIEDDLPLQRRSARIAAIPERKPRYAPHSRSSLPAPLPARGSWFAARRNAAGRRRAVHLARLFVVPAG